MRLRFTKMHGLGNDFVMIDTITQKARINSEVARIIADRNFGIGCDQVLVVEPPETPKADFRYRIFNNDGGEVENCGNGARCFALFVLQRQLTIKTTIKVETAGGLLTLIVNDDDSVTVNMGAPIFDPINIPYNAAAQNITYALTLNSKTVDSKALSPETLHISAISMGNPHAVTIVNNLSAYPVDVIGAEIEQHKDFPSRVNAGFMQIISRQEIKLRVYERGVGETLACGTGACAAVVSGITQGLLDNNVEVHLTGGKLRIKWLGEQHPVIMTGPAVTVFSGHIKL